MLEGIDITSDANAQANHLELAAGREFSTQKMYFEELCIPVSQSIKRENHVVFDNQVNQKKTMNRAKSSSSKFKDLPSP